MNKLNRKSFLKLGTLAMMAPLTNRFYDAGASPFNQQKGSRFKDDLLKRMIAANDNKVAALLQAPALKKQDFSRKLGSDFAMLAAALVTPGSAWFQSQKVISQLEKITQLLASVQSEDGTVNIGNLESPPDTAFLVELLGAGAGILQQLKSPEIAPVKTGIKNFLVKTGEALTIGGVHTPNHRWVISAALARLNDLYPDEKYVNRINEWLGEGIFMDEDGHYPERSQTYSYVEDNSLITMGRLLNMPSLFEAVRRNLGMTYYYMDPNGDLVTTDSRRQDQYMSKNIVSFYLHYRYMAIRDNSSQLAGITRLIENLEEFEEEVIKKDLFHFLDMPLLQQELPEATPPPVNYEKLFATSGLLRIRRNNTTATLFGGADWPITIASGRSNSPNIFAYRKGKAILKYLRLSTNFFSMGYFYSQGIAKNGSTYLLQKKLEVPYYQPLPKNFRNQAGDYKLSPSIDNRFWNKMDFENRPVSNVKTLDTAVSLDESNGNCELTFRVEGFAGVPVTIELCFMEGGKLSGVSAVADDNNFLETGTGKYELGGDAIEFGPGSLAHKSIKNLEGERYSTHFGTLRTDGMHVYLTGVTPFKHTIHFR